jgi:hypothetical protein
MFTSHTTQAMVDGTWRAAQQHRHSPDREKPGSLPPGFFLEFVDLLFPFDVSLGEALL